MPFPYPNYMYLHRLRVFTRTGVAVKLEEFDTLMAVLTTSWRYPELDKATRSLHKRTTGGYPLDTALEVLDDLVRIGSRARPAPQELCGLIRQKLGLRAASSGYVQAPGPFLDEEVPAATAVPDDVRTALDRGRELNASARRARLDAARKGAA